MSDFATRTAWSAEDVNFAHQNKHGVRDSEIVGKLLSTGESKKVIYISKPGKLEKLWDKLCASVSALFKSKSFDKRVGEYHAKVLDQACNKQTSELPAFLQDATVFKPSHISAAERNKPWRLVEKNTRSKSAKKADAVAATVIRSKANAVQGTDRKGPPIVADAKKKKKHHKAKKSASVPSQAHKALEKNQGALPSWLDGEVFEPAK